MVSIVSSPRRRPFGKAASGLLPPPVRSWRRSSPPQQIAVGDGETGQDRDVRVVRAQRVKVATISPAKRLAASSSETRHCIRLSARTNQGHVDRRKPQAIDLSQFSIASIRRYPIVSFHQRDAGRVTDTAHHRRVGAGLQTGDDRRFLRVCRLAPRISASARHPSSFSPPPAFINVPSSTRHSCTSPHRRTAPAARFQNINPPIAHLRLPRPLKCQESTS